MQMPRIALIVALIVASVGTIIGCLSPASTYEADVTSEILIEYDDSDDQFEHELAQFNQIAAAFGGAQIARTTDE